MTDTNLPRKKVYKKIKSNASTFFYFVAEKLKCYNKKLKKIIIDGGVLSNYEDPNEQFAKYIRYCRENKIPFDIAKDEKKRGLLSQQSPLYNLKKTNSLNILHTNIYQIKKY